MHPIVRVLSIPLLAIFALGLFAAQRAKAADSDPLAPWLGRYESDQGTYYVHVMERQDTAESGKAAVAHEVERPEQGPYYHDALEIFRGPRDTLLLRYVSDRGSCSFAAYVRPEGGAFRADEVIRFGKRVGAPGKPALPGKPAQLVFELRTTGEIDGKIDGAAVTLHRETQFNCSFSEHLRRVTTLAVGDSPLSGETLIATCDAAMGSRSPFAIADQRGLSDPANRIENPDWRNKSLEGQDLHEKVIIGGKMAGTDLDRANLSGSVICNSDLAYAGLAGAQLTGAVIQGSTLKGANLSHAEARGLDIEMSSTDGMRVDAADLEDASIGCDQNQNYMACLNVESEHFASMDYADLRGAHVQTLCCALGLEAATLAGVKTEFNFAPSELPRFAAALGDADAVTFTQAYGMAGAATTFTGAELRRLLPMLPALDAPTIKPSFDCAAARSTLEKAVCRNPMLSTLDAALSWVWGHDAHDAAALATERAWLASRERCFEAAGASASRDSLLPPGGCLSQLYIDRISKIAASAQRDGIPDGVYLSGGPIVPPAGADIALLRKFFLARGLRRDSLKIAHWTKEGGEFTGSGLWGNGHTCGFNADDVSSREGLIEHLGTPWLKIEPEGVSFVVTPSVIVRVGGGGAGVFCGARGMWSDLYFRLPAELVSDFEANAN